MNYDREELFSYIKYLVDKLSFRIFLKNRNPSGYRRWSELMMKNHKEIKSNAGATKIVLPYKDIVIKIPYSVCDGRFNNYCEEEVNNYIHAVENKVDDFFAPCEFIGRFYYCGGSVPIYVMEKVSLNEDCNNIQGSYDFYGHSGYSYDEMSDNENLIANVFSNWYDDEDVINLLDFIRSYGINDIHDENIGFRFSDGYPLIIDYSGY